MLKLNLQDFGHLMRRTDSLEKTLMLWKIKDRRQRGTEKTKLLCDITNLMNMSLYKLWDLVMDRELYRAAPHDIEKSWTWLKDWTELMYRGQSGSRQKSLGKEE